MTPILSGIPGDSPREHANRRRSTMTGRLLMATGLLILVAGCGAESTGAQAELDQGLEAHVAGDYDTALRHYRQALVLDPESKFAYYNIGLIDHLNGRVAAAAANYRAALEIDADYVPALFNLAILESQSDRLDEAVELYQRVIELDPERAGAHLNLGLVLAELGRSREAEAALQRAMELDPELVIPDVTPSPAG